MLPEATRARLRDTAGGKERLGKERENKGGEREKGVRRRRAKGKEKRM